MTRARSPLRRPYSRYACNLAIPSSTCRPTRASTVMADPKVASSWGLAASITESPIARMGPGGAAAACMLDGGLVIGAEVDGVTEVVGLPVEADLAVAGAGVLTGT